MVLVRTQTQKYVVVPQHGPLLLYTKLEGPSITKNECLFSMVPVRPLDGFEGPLDVHGHGALGLCVRATLALGITQQTMPWLGFCFYFIWSASSWCIWSVDGWVVTKDI